jgi:uncharacterized protein (TIGR02996 family)
VNDELALLAAIEEHPGEDTPRLVLADWYDEHGPPAKARDQRLAVLLRRIKETPSDDAPRLEYARVCQRYGGTEKAEFIRVQCELATLRAQITDPREFGVLAGKLITRERELLALRRDEWLAPPPGFHGTWRVTFGGQVHHAAWLSDTPGPMGGTIVFDFVRGFAEVVTCDPGTWFCHHAAIRNAWPVTRVEFLGVPQSSVRANGLVFFSDDYDDDSGQPRWFIQRSDLVRQENEGFTDALLRIRFPGIAFRTL